MNFNGSTNEEKGEKTPDNSAKVCNIFRDTPLRFLGYANEVGESFRYQFPRLVTPSYILAFGYCFADAASTGCRAWNNYDDGKGDRSKHAVSAIATCDTLLWQCAASVMIPGATINLIVKVSRFAVSRNTTLPTVVAAWLPTAVGLSSIPFIVKPIDDAVDFMMDCTIRQWIEEEKKSP